MESKNTLQKDYGNLIPTIKKLSLAAQFISGSTAAFGIYAVMIQKMPFSIKAIAVLITIILTTIIIGSFEGGIRKLYPYWVRQILSWSLNGTTESKRQKSVRVILFSMLCILLLPLVLGTTISSWQSSPDLIAFSSPKPQVQDLTQLNASLNKNTTLLIEQYQKDIQQDSLLFINHLKALKSSWDAKIKAKEVQRKKYLGLYAKGHQWAAGSAAKIKNRIIPDLIAQKAVALQQLHTVRTNKLDSLQKYKATTLLTAQQSKNRLLSDSKKKNDLLFQKADSNIYKWGHFLAVLAIISTFFTLFCFTFIEAYKAGIINPKAHTPPKLNTNKSIKGHTSKLPFKERNYVAHSTQPLTVTHKHTQQVDFVSIDKLIKRTRMQWQRSLDTEKDEIHRTTNLQKAVENIAFLKSLGVSVQTDQLDETKLIISKKEIA